MKQLHTMFRSLVLALTLLVGVGNVGFAAESLPQKHTKAEVYTLKAMDRPDPLVVTVVTVGDVSQTLAPQEYWGLNLWVPHCTSRAFPLDPKTVRIPILHELKDKRALIFRHLFPFHFFW